MPKIERLTPGQEAELPRFRARFMQYAIGGSRIDRPVLEKAMADAYAVIGKPAPKVFIFDSPAACMLAIKIFEMGGKKLGQLAGQLRSQLGDQMLDQMLDQLRSQLGGQLQDQLRSQLRDQMLDQLAGQLRGQMVDQLAGQLRNQLGDQLGGQLQDQLVDQLEDQLGGQILDQILDQLGDQKIWNPNFLWGSQDLYWLAWAKFGQQIGVKYPDEAARNLDTMIAIGQQCEWWWPFEHIVIASEKPVQTSWDDARRLHSETGPAIKYADGYSLHAWHGLRVPTHWIENRADLDPNEVIKHENVEMRAAGAAIVGWPKMLSVLKAKVLDADPDPSHGELIELKLPGLPRPGRFLKAECPRNGTICEGVPPVSEIDGLPINTVKAAQSWRVGLRTDQFSYPEVRT